MFLFFQRGSWILGPILVLVIGQQGVLSQSVEQLLAEAKATESIENLLEDAVVEKGCNKIHFWILQKGPRSEYENMGAKS